MSITAVPISILWFGPDGREERERRGELLGEVMDPEVGAVGTQFLDRLSQLDRLDQCVRPRPDLRIWRRRPVSEREEPDLLHPWILRSIGGGPDRDRGADGHTPPMLCVGIRTERRTAFEPSLDEEFRAS